MCKCATDSNYAICAAHHRLIDQLKDCIPTKFVVVVTRGYGRPLRRYQPIEIGMQQMCMDNIRLELAKHPPNLPHHAEIQMMADGHRANVDTSGAQSLTKLRYGVARVFEHDHAYAYTFINEAGEQSEKMTL